MSENEHQSRHTGDPDQYRLQEEVERLRAGLLGEQPAPLIRIEMPHNRPVWEYKTVSAWHLPQNHLDELGSEGWQACIYNAVREVIIFIREAVDDGSTSAGG